MVDIAAVQAEFDDAFANDLSGVSFQITYQSPLVGYDVVSGGPAVNTNPILDSQAFITERSRDEVDNESMKLSKLTIILMRSWLSVEPIVGGLVTVLSGDFAGIWRIEREPESTVIHWELSLVR